MVRLFRSLNVTAACLLFLISVAAWPRLPAQLPVHFDMAGTRTATLTR